ncbi:haloacid dehalogenase type II [Parasalinivibrio latis]|uniref:haloacid dehalogenase type II n=1 Tax=Parasalinivibrio latis TaxID=2952610 RepID=UPI0030E49DF4
MAITLAFDVYGTLIDTQGVTVLLKSMVGDKAEPFATLWREKQLEYSFRRGLMQNYEDFATCTRQSLEYTCMHHNVSLSESQKQLLMDSYSSLPAFQDVRQALEVLGHSGHRRLAFSNGTHKAVTTVLSNCGLINYFEEVVSVDDLKTFKPNPACYAYFLRSAGSTTDQTWLVSSNPFDVIGALSAGMRAAWVKRSKNALFDPWGIQPTLTVSNLLELVQHPDFSG